MFESVGYDHSSLVLKAFISFFYSCEFVALIDVVCA